VYLTELTSSWYIYCQKSDEVATTKSAFSRMTQMAATVLSNKEKPTKLSE
jgi:hypothetical protein